MQIFIYKHKMVLLTEEGKALLHYATRIISWADEARQVLTDYAQFKIGKIVIGSSNTPATHFLPKLLGRMRELYPDVHIALQVKNSPQIVEMVRKFEIDFGLVAEYKVDDPKLECVPLIEDELGLVVYPGHALADAEAIEPGMLQNGYWILREQDSASRRMMETWIGQHHIKSRRRRQNYMATIRLHPCHTLAIFFPYLYLRTTTFRKEGNNMKKIAWTLTSLICLLAACSNGNSNGTAGASSPAKAPIENETASEPVTLTFSTYFLSDQMKTAVTKYESMHPNVTIQLQATPSYGKDLDEAAAYRETFLTSTNAAILAGKGPDLVEMDILPIEAYADRHLLVNLQDIMSGDASFHSQDYFTNILDNARLNDGLYGIPLYFYLDGLLGDTAAIDKTGVPINDSDWTWNDFMDAAKQLQQKGEYKTALISEPSVLLSELTVDNFTQLVKEKNGERKFDSDSFIDLIHQVKSMIDDGLLFDMVKDGGGRGSATTLQTKAYFNAWPIDSFESYLLNGFAEQTKLYTMPHPHSYGAGGYFSTFGMVGINANSPHKQEAWKFLEFLMDDEAKTITDASISSHGFPINKNAYDLQVEKLKEAGTIQSDVHPEIAVDTEKLDRLKGSITEAVHWVRTPSEIEETIRNESKAYFSGQKSAESVAKLVQSKINLILNE
ncbi:extracellular solute-binding protein [Paenibacillus rhizovicinus]|uniref:Extracellular solute-binding protein n=1 Tax=Paenibacillus rhizovicinus TaxID=2704463 RepID=A0A6C0P8E1_9BACL|nr:extracellular solute-binding protein [Paenibacillus rhizovicinus]QHW33903.1 extracellular solute-binding protein [Paenibacillus rhizovicinus]